MSNPSTTPLRWGIASTGKIATSMTEALSSLDDAAVIAVGSRSDASAAEFAERHGIERAHGSYDALWADSDVDIVYVASPHSEHHRMTLAALGAGKHVLCEKAFAINAAQAGEMIETARRHDRFLMEAMWSWFMPAWNELRARVAGGAIGEIVSVDANFCLPIADENGRHRRLDLAGGALLDLGIYPIALGRFLLGEPTDVKVLGRLTDGGVDGLVGGVMQHTGGAVTTFTTSLDAMSDLSARVVGTDATIVIEAPFWFPSSFTIRRRDGAEPEVVNAPNRGLAHEAEHTMECIRRGQHESDIQTWAATMANMELMDEIRSQLGVVYPDELSESGVG
jgi:predicted dehydrogenase